MLLVSIGVIEEFGILNIVVLGTVFSAAGAFLWMFPGSRFFELPFANSLALYASAFFFLSIANFAIADPWADGVAYLLPMAGVAGLTFVVPGMALDALGTGIALIGFMAAIAVFVFLDSRQICLFLIDTGLLFDRLFGHMGRLFRPAFAFFTPYSFIVIVSAMIFRIMERLAGEPIFLIEVVPAAVTFSDSLYFSLITISNVGYGDITPFGDAVRAVAAVEIILGILLILFGFAEIIRYARDPDADGNSDT